MPIVAALLSVAGLAGVAVVAPILTARRSAWATPIVYGASLVLAAVLLICGLLGLLGGNAFQGSVHLPVGLPWIGAHFTLDPLSAAFLIIVDFGAMVASFYAIGYGAHEEEPGRVLPFYPAFLAGMNLVVLSADAFGFLVAWEFMSLSSWALVMAHHHDEENRRAGYVYLLMASFGTLMLLLAFGLLAGPDGDYVFSAIRTAEHVPWLTGLVLVLMLFGAGSRPVLCRCTSGCRSRIRPRPAMSRR